MMETKGMLLTLPLTLSALSLHDVISRVEAIAPSNFFFQITHVEPRFPHSPPLLVFSCSRL